MSDRPAAYELTGGCHCQAIGVRYRTRFPIGVLHVGRCGCSFCRRHGARTSADAGGSLAITERAPGAERYRFGLKTADFLICRGCGVYVAAIIRIYGADFATLNVNVLDDRDAFDPAPPIFHYDNETDAERIARRRQRWTPTTLLKAD